jgi:group I intron endonuclease
MKITKTNLYKEKNNNIINIMEKINFASLDNKGLIKNPGIELKDRAGVYIYQLVQDKNKIYIGSSYNIRKRIVQHRQFINNRFNLCPKFYNSVRKHGWSNFQLGVIEYIDLSILNPQSKKEMKKAILLREQYYLDNINPTLNVCKIAGSMLGYKHTEEVRKIMGLQRRGKSINWSKKDLSYFVSNVTKNNLSLSARNGIKVKVFDINNNLIKIFPTISSAALYYDIDHNTLSKNIKLGYKINDLRFEYELKDVRVWVFDKERNVIGVFPTANKTAEFCGTSHVAIGRYLKSGKLWKDKYYFSRTLYLT